MREIAARRPLPDDVVEQIVAKTDGVPLFVEELTKAVLESDRTGALSALAIPATLEDSLRARLDPREAMGDRIIDGLIVAGLEMQEGVAFEAAPVAAIERVVAL